ncbi:MAG: MG2 domain-containing protein [Bacteroidetes bacterium]|nr:MG2 domain-containing protein [Bacteroidota bacterium]
MTKKLIQLILLIIAFTANSCTDKPLQTNEQSDNFKTLVQAYTNGIISVGDEIMVRFNNEIPGARQGDVLAGNPLVLDPQTKGTSYWRDGKTLAFKPENWLKPNQSYSCQINIGAILPEMTAHQKPLVFSFQTKKQDVLVSADKFITQGKFYRLEGSVLLADVAPNNAVEKLISLDDEKLQSDLQWQHLSGDNHRFVIDSIVRLEANKTLIINYDGQAVGAETKGELAVEIPGLSTFKLIRTVVEQEPAQVLKLEFSDPLHPTQDITGLISLNENTNLRTKKTANTLTIYPTDRIIETQKLIVSGDLKNELGYPLGQDTTFEVNFEPLKPDVRFVQSGVIVPDAPSGGHVVFQAVNLNAVDLFVIQVFEQNIPYFLQQNQLDGSNNLTNFGRLILKKKIDLTAGRALEASSWNTYSFDLKQLLKSDPGAIYRIELRFKKDYSTYSCSNESQDDDSQLTAESEENYSEIWDKGLYWPQWNYTDDYDWRQQDNPCHNTYYQNRWVYRNVMVSDLGIIVKTNGKKGYRAFVTDLKTTQSLAGIEVSFYNLQNQLMGSGHTNNQGTLDLKFDDQPWLAVAKRGNEKTWLRVDEASALSYATFDVTGSESVEGLNAFIYGERGVWRPGDTIHLTMVVNDAENPLPENQPATLHLYNPENKLVQKIVQTNPVNKFYTFSFLTQKEDPTGNWLAKVKIGGAWFSKTLRIETIKPNRLKIKLDFDEEILSATKPVNGNLDVNWLHGAPGKKLKVKTDLKFRAVSTTFKGYPGFVFSDPAKTLDMREETVFDGSTDASGKASFSFEKNLTEFAPSMLKAVFTVKAFEPGGEFSITQQSKDYSPFETYIGLRMPELPKNNWHYESGKDYQIEVASVDWKGNPTNADELLVEVFKLQWEWWWHSNGNDLAYYVQQSHNKPIQSQVVQTRDGKGSFKLSIDKNSWGRYLVRVSQAGGHSTGEIVYFDWPYRKSNEGDGFATRLSFSADKESYQKGEKIKLNIPGEPGSKALVSVEAGTRILQHFWVDITENGGTIELEATKEMAPNAYISVSLLQPYAQTINENPLRMYGTIPVFVTDPDTKLEPEIKLPESVEPKQSFSLEVKEQNGHPMTYTLAIVDEGLLDITNFKTPDIHAAFYRRKALMVNTWDMFDFVSGAFGGKIEKVFGIGGDEALNALDKKEQNRFKPVVLFSGPHQLKQGETAVHGFTMPNYIGSIKAMIIAGNNTQFGSTDEVMAVKKPVMVLATLPRVLAPGDKITLPVSAFIMDENIKSARISIQTNELLLAKSTQKEITISETGEQTVFFELDVAAQIGIAEVNVLIETDRGKADYSLNVEVRNPNPPIKLTQQLLLEADESKKLSTAIPGMPGSNSFSLEVSAMPPLNLSNRLNYLISYPYGCVEQIVSSAFPQLYVDQLIEPTGQMRRQMENNIKAALNKLMQYQQPNGGFSYWPGGGYTSSWGTTYALHFLLEAERKGYVLPFGIKDKAITHLQSQSSSWSRNFNDAYYDLDQAYRLYVLALSGNPDLSGMNRQRQKSGLDERSKWRLAAAYTLVGKSDVAESLLDMTRLEIAEYEDMSHTYGSALRDYAMLLETLISLDKKEAAARLIKDFSEVLSDSDQWLSTQTTAWMLMSVAKAKPLLSGDAGKLDFSYQIQNEKAIRQQSEQLIEIIRWENDTDSAVAVTNHSEGVLFVTYRAEGVPLKDQSKSIKKNIGLNLRFYDLNGNLLSPENIPQGTDFKAVFEISYTGISRSSSIKNIALRQIFPSGWEIINSRLYGEGYQQSGDQPNYLDIRDDRVSLFFDLNPKKIKRFEILLNAAYEGRYTLPAAVVEAMYSDKFYARSQSKTVAVIKE